jgi:FtsZ-interacting cell division protein ZipA
MTLADLRKELKTLRKAAMPIPVSRMKKGDVTAELERLRGKEETAVKEVMKEEKVPKKTVKKVEAVQKVAHKEQEEAEVKKTRGVKRAASPPPAKKAKTESKPAADKPTKGSEEMKARMAKLREMRKAKKDA